jgi:long-chain acyl-CoA synthetase
MIANRLSEFFQRTAREDRGCFFVHSSSQEERWLAYAEMYSKANAIAEKIRDLPIRHRFIAVIWMDQSPESFIAFMSVVLAEGIPVPIHPTSKCEEAFAVLEKVEADVVMLSASQALQVSNLLSSGMTDGSFLRKVCCMNGETGEALKWMLPWEVSGEYKKRRYTPPKETAAIFMSSGSTGSPKGIMLSDENLLSNVHAIQSYLKLTEMDRVLLTKSYGYSSTITGEWLLSLLTGAHIYMTAGFFHPLHTVRLIRDYETTFMCTVPSALLPLVKSSKWQSEDLHSLKKLIIVGGQMPVEMLIQLQNRLPWVEMMPCYGLTEASPRVSFLPSHQLMKKQNSVGIPISRVQVGIYQDGQQVDNGSIGEIVVCGPNVMLGYYDDLQRTASVLPSYGLRTADMGYMDEEGYIFITGRLDNALNIAGHTLYPETMEKIIYSHPAVQEVAVAGIPDEVWGHLPIAFVVPNDPLANEKKIIEELFLFCQEHLSAVQRPKEIVLIPNLPKRENGKLDRSYLQSIVKEKNYDSHHRTGH